MDLGGYVAAGVVAFDLRTRAVRWQQHLDLSTDVTTLKAYAYAAPTLADLDGDGKLEVVVGTSMARIRRRRCLYGGGGLGSARLEGRDGLQMWGVLVSNTAVMGKAEAMQAVLADAEQSSMAAQDPLETF